MLKLAAVAGLGLLAGGGMVSNIYRFDVSRQRLAVAGLQAPVLIAQLSDLHYGDFLKAGSVSRWVESTLAAEPDLIVLTGDYIDSRTRADPAPFFDAIAPLTAPLGVWAAWGNHDHVSRGRLSLLADSFRRAGFGLLVNSSVKVRDDLQLAAIDDWKLGSPDIAGTLGGLMAEVPSVFITHNPDALAELPAGSVSVALAGHTHGGQVRLPLVGAPHTSSAYGQRFVQGWVEAPVPAYVSRGLGVTALPVRLSCPPELVLLELLPG